MIPFSLERKAMGVVVKVVEGRWHLYLKGTRHVMVVCPGEDIKGEVDDEVETKEIDAVVKDNLEDNHPLCKSDTEELRCIIGIWTYVLSV